MENKAKLYGKITELANELGAIKEDGNNNFDHYAFISYQNVNARLRQLLPKYKLAIVPSVTNYEERDYTTQKGSQSIRSVVSMSFLLVDTETGYSEERAFVGGDQDTKGKSLGQAITECQKRFEMKLFHVSSTEADPDSKSIENKPNGLSEEQKHQNFIKSIEILADKYADNGLSFENTLIENGIDTYQELLDIPAIQRKIKYDRLTKILEEKAKETK
jgi:hypothetical protein